MEGTLKWKLLDGDFRHLHEAYINGDITDKQGQELHNLLFDNNWKLLPDLQELTTAPFPPHDFVILTGFIP
jgi:hypothetical protein